MPDLSPGCEFGFGRFCLDLKAGELYRNGRKLRLTGQPIHILGVLVEHAGAVVTRQELRDELWPLNTYVEFDDSLNTAIGKLRAALGDDADHPTYIETIPRRGYRFIAPVEGTAAAANGAPPAKIIVRKMPLAKLASHSGFIVWLWRIAVLATAMLVVIGVAIMLVMRGKTPPTAPVLVEIHSLAVLPLKNLSKDPDEQYFADGMTEELITRVASLEGVRVISRTSVMRYKETTKSLPEIASELHVDAIVEGTVLQAGNRVRITAQLIQGGNDQHLWAESYERDARDVLDLQDAVARDIAAKVAARLSPAAEAALSRPDPVNPEAYQAYLRGRYHWHTRQLDDLHQAVAEFQQALAIDPMFAPAYAGLADCYIVLPMVDPDANQAKLYPKAKQAAERALALDSSLAEVHNSVAYARMYQDWDFVGAEQAFKQAIRLNPNYSTAHQWYAELLALEGRHQEAEAEIQKAEELDPFAAIIYHQAGQVYQQARQYDRAIKEYNKAIALQFQPTYLMLSNAYRHKGMFHEAARMLVFGWRDDPGLARIALQLEPAYQRDGERGYFHKLVQINKRYMRPNYYLALDDAVLGKDDEAFQYLEEAYRLHETELLFVNVDPEWDHLRSDPRLIAMMKKIGLQEATRGQVSSGR